MKHLLLCIVVLFLSTWLFAQKGKIELAFGSTLAHCDSVLTLQHLETQDSTGFVYVYRPTEDSDHYGILNRLNLYLDKQKWTLDNWVAYYKYPPYGDIEKDMLAQYTQLYGDNYTTTHDDYYGGRNLYTWTLDAKHFVEIGTSGDVYHVWYGRK